MCRAKTERCSCFPTVARSEPSAEDLPSGWQSGTRCPRWMRGKTGFLRYDFPSLDGSSCSGRLSVLIEVLLPKPLLVVFGGGHVGTSLLRLAKPTGFRALLFDDRAEDQIPEAVSLADRFVRVEHIEHDILTAELPAGAFFVLCGHDHAVDGEALAAALQKSPRYIGMLASRPEGSSRCLPSSKNAA